MDFYSGSELLEFISFCLGKEMSGQPLHIQMEDLKRSPTDATHVEPTKARDGYSAIPSVHPFSSSRSNIANIPFAGYPLFAAVHLVKIEEFASQGH